MKQESENTLKDPRKNGQGRKTVDKEEKKVKSNKYSCLRKGFKAFTFFNKKKGIQFLQARQVYKFPSSFRSTDEEPKGQREEVTCLKLHIKLLTKPTLKFRSADSQCNVNFLYQNFFFYTIIFTT